MFKRRSSASRLLLQVEHRVRRLAQEVGHRRQRGMDARASSFARENPEALAHLVEPAEVRALRGVAETHRLAERYLRHEFDVLGSGWVQAAYGTGARGVRGHRYDSQVEEGGMLLREWLHRVLSPANVSEGNRIWSLLDPTYVPIDWQRDLRSGYRWTEHTWYRDIRVAPAPGADIKVPWELARMQHLVQLAVAYLHSPLPVYPWEFRNEILDFVGSNPPRFGVNWACTMEVAIRLINWLLARDLFRAAGVEWDAEFEAVFARSVLEHGRHIARNLEWSPLYRGNHYLANVVGLIFAGASLSGDEADGWLAFAARELIGETAYQFLPDGANFEGSTCYHELSMEFVVHGAAVLLGLPASRARRLRRLPGRRWPRRTRVGHAPALAPSDPLPPAFVERLDAMCAFSLGMRHPDGSLPQVGDNDSGRLIRPAPVVVRVSGAEAERFAEPEVPRGSEYLWVAPLRQRPAAAAAAGLFDGGAWVDASADTGIVRALARGRTLARSAPPALAGEARMDPAAWECFQHALTQAGPGQHRSYRIALPGGVGTDLRRVAWSHFGLYLFHSKRVYLSVRCGPIGQQGLGGHAHNDQLAVELVVDGALRIADPGTYTYTALPEERDAYRSVAAHFAPRVLGCEPARLGPGLFRLGDEARASCLAFGERGFLGMHRGFGIPVYRSVRVDGDVIYIDDVVVGGVEELVDLEDWLVFGRGAGAPAFSPGYGMVYR